MFHRNSNSQEFDSFRAKMPDLATHMERSTSAPPAPETPQENYDVFISFRGQDTRYNFTSHLYAALCRLKIKTYIDEELERGDEISPTLLRAIEGAKVSVIVFSKNYATSRWCLDELVKIMECKLKNQQKIVPVFYYIDPTHVRHQTGSFADAFAKHEEHYKNNMNKVLKWRLALGEAANHSGWDCLVNRVEAELVEKISLDVLQKLDSLRGLESRIASCKQMAKKKLEKSLITGKQSDADDLIGTLEHLSELKIEKAIATENVKDWEDIAVTNKRIVFLKQEKYHRTKKAADKDDFEATLRRASKIESEINNRKYGLFATGI